jgi:hypothetical protein
VMAEQASSILEQRKRSGPEPCGQAALGRELWSALLSADFFTSCPGITFAPSAGSYTTRIDGAQAPQSQYCSTVRSGNSIMIHSASYRYRNSAGQFGLVQLRSMSTSLFESWKT